MRPEIAFFDIDGTLLEFGADRIAPAVIEAVRRLRRGGCRIFLATGRAPFMLPDLGDLPVDGLMCFNGSLCFDAAGPLFADPPDAAQTRTVLANADRLGLPVIVATDRDRACTFRNADLEDYLRLSPHPCPPLDRARLRDAAVYQLTVPTRADLAAELLRGTTELAVSRWCERAVDVIPRRGGKARAMREILAHYGMRREKALAFGDGGNDIEMLRHAGLGVAMGDAPEAVRAAADHVAAACADAGVRRALEELGLI